MAAISSTDTPCRYTWTSLEWPAAGPDAGNGGAARAEGSGGPGAGRGQPSVAPAPLPATGGAYARRYSRAGARKRVRPPRNKMMILSGLSRMLCGSVTGPSARTRTAPRSSNAGHRSRLNTRAQPAGEHACRHGGGPAADRRPLSRGPTVEVLPGPGFVAEAQTRPAPRPALEPLPLRGVTQAAHPPQAAGETGGPGGCASTTRRPPERTPRPSPASARVLADPARN
jgi:hypothetical protein